MQPLAVAKLLAAVARQEQPGLFLLGKQAIDDDSNQVGAGARPAGCWAERGEAPHELGAGLGTAAA